MKNNINVIDLFAGPGGLGEGFCAFQSSSRRKFKIRMSVEKEASAHATLTLRALYRILRDNNNHAPYFAYVEGRLTKDELIQKCAKEWAEAAEETMQRPTALGEDNERIHKHLRQLKKIHANEPWVVIGGPPCQAYSLVGRARNKGIEGYSAEGDHRHFLYQEYLKVLSIIEPDVFVMENVKGILSSSVRGEAIFPRILKDLEHPGLTAEGRRAGRTYQIYSLVRAPDSTDLLNIGYSDNQDYIIRAENFGVPQTRHRVILLGVATDSGNRTPQQLIPAEQVPIEHVLQGLPDLRSRLSTGEDCPSEWRSAITKSFRLVRAELKPKRQHEAVLDAMAQSLASLKTDSPISGTAYKKAPVAKETPKALATWLLKDRPAIVLNHHARGHMNSDLGRYFFSACWALPAVYGNSDKPFPKAEDYPNCLAPAHVNWSTGKFADRFRVQRYSRPATTVTSHISKDGHYFIHPDPTQCRSLTVREAARIQTFSDNYFFEGNRTQQYVQVGNAVPPFLATQLANIVLDLL